MDANYQAVFIIGAVEDSDSPPLEEASHGTPHEVVPSSKADGALKENPSQHCGFIYARHDAFNGAVLSGRVDGLKDEQHRPAAVGVKLLL